MMYALRRDAFQEPILNDWQALDNYLHATMSHARHECVRVLYLNKVKRLIREDELCEGTLDEALVPVRTVMARALDLGASGILLVHNHPSGSPEPSRADIDLTKCMSEAGKRLDVAVLDHIIVGRTGQVSLRGRGLI